MDPLEELARAAEAHAGVPLDAEVVDRLLRSISHPTETLAAAFGAWLGREAVRRCGARWIGLAEPSPPRVEIRGVIASPIDAVRRRLVDPAAPSIPEVLRRFEAWARPDADPRPANAAAWDALAEDPRFAGPIPLSAGAIDPWLGEVAGRDLLCLGAGGGRQGPLHAAAGARVTVVDLSERQIEHDRRAGLRVVRTSIDDLSPLAAASFDVVVQPVSSCYVPDVRRVYAEVARVLRPGGLYVAQHKQPASLQGGLEPYRDGLPLPPSTEPHREAGTLEFLHTLEALLGGLCAAGFVIEDVAEPPRADALAPPGTPGHRAWHLPPYLKVKARRR